VINGYYSDNDLFAANTITSDVIDLTTAVTPQLTWWAWVNTEWCCDGYNVQVSSDGGATWQVVAGVVPAYNTSFEGLSAWSGGLAAWEQYSADLSAYAGQQIRLRFAFHTDVSVVYEGVYIDDVFIAG
jgi:bacillopeptidase F (M6 metalloprotease family)